MEDLAFILSLFAALLLFLGVSSGSVDPADNDPIVGEPDQNEETGSDDEGTDNGDNGGSDDGADNGDSDNPLADIENLMNGYFEGLAAYYNEGNEDVFNYLENDSGNLYNLIVENGQSGEYEDFLVTYWQVTNVDTLQQGVYMVTMDREYNYGDGEEISDTVTYAIRETEGQLEIVDQEPDGGNGDDDESDNGDSGDALAQVEDLMNGYYEALGAYYNGGSADVFNYLANDTSDLYNKIVNNHETGEFENYLMRYWQVTNVETLEDGLYHISIEREYTYGDDQTIADTVVYEVRESDGRLYIVDQF